MGEVEINQNDVEDSVKYWNTVYKELSQVIGVEATLLLYEAYRGTQFNLPMRLLAKDKMIQVLEREQGQLTSKELAKKYGYTERHIQRMLKQMKIEGKKEDERK